MPTEFEVIYGEFANELDALSEMTVGSLGVALDGPTARARIAAGNGATLLLAAIFEEFVRQQICVAFKEKAKRARGMSDFPAKIASTVWRRSLESLARTPFEEIEADGAKTDAQLTATLAFCLRKELTADVSEALSRNDSNMRSVELNRLFNQIGLPGLVAQVSEDQELVEFLGVGTPGKANTTIEAKCDEFFRRRNDIAHAIKLGSSSGPTALHQDIDFFRVFGRALSTTLQRLIERKPASVEPAP